MRFPSAEQRQFAWTRYQNTVAAVKAQREEANASREARGTHSTAHLDRIMRLVDAAGPDSDFADAAMFVATGGLSMIVGAAMDAAFGETDQARLSLERRGRVLRDAGAYLKDNKLEMFGSDKSAAHVAITEARAALDHDWATYKGARHEAYLARKNRREEKDRRHRDWHDNQQAFLGRLTDALDRKSSQLRHQERHLAALYDKRSDGTSANYRDRVDGWIYEVKQRIVELERAVEDIGEKIAEVRAKL